MLASSLPARASLQSSTSGLMVVPSMRSAIGSNAESLLMPAASQLGSGGSRGANPAMAPIEVGNGVWRPLGGRNSNGRIVNLCKFKDFGPPLIDVGYGFWPPPYGKPAY